MIDNTKQNMSPAKWSEMTEHDIMILTQKQCRKCKYLSRPNGECVASSTCDYIDMEGHSRGCSPLECKQKGIFTPRQGSRKRKVRRL